MAIMTTAQYEHCGHEACDMEPCTAFAGISYVKDDVWGWGTQCDQHDEQFFVATLPEEHYEEAHNG